MKEAIKLVDLVFKSCTLFAHERTKFKSAYCGTAFLKDGILTSLGELTVLLYIRCCSQQPSYGPCYRVH